MPVPRHVDYGTYTGFALPRLSELATNIDSFDIDPAKLWRAQNRFDVKPLIQSGKVRLHEMDAKAVAFADNIFDSATIVEVFGAGFEGEERDIATVFNGLRRILKPGGVGVFTVKSKTTEQLLETIGFQENKGTPVDKDRLNLLLCAMFETVDWYGQLILKKTNKGFFIPLPALGGTGEKETFGPRRLANPRIEHPMFWVGVCKKSGV